MNTELKLTIVDGPNRERLMDVFRMQYLEGRDRPAVEIQVAQDFVGDGKDALGGAILRVKAPIRFNPAGIKYEDGSGESFIIEGYATVVFKGEASTMHIAGYYNTKRRTGVLDIPTSAVEYKDFKKVLDYIFFGKIDEFFNERRKAAAPVAHGKSAKK